MLEIKHLHVAINGQPLLHDINLTIPDGDIHALLGPNGSGKTSLMMTIMGFSRYEITQGQIFFDGEDITNLDLTDRAKLGIGIAQQRPPTIAGVKLGQVLDYIVVDSPERKPALEKAVQTFGVESLLTRHINAGLSGGEIKRSELLQLIAARPRFAMMDEPDSGVDLESLRMLGEMVNALYTPDPERPGKRRTGLIVTHTGSILDYIYADKAHVMLNGHIACSGNPRLILSTVAQDGYEACIHCV